MDSITKPRPSEWVKKYSSLLRYPGPILDVASGGGRHTRYLLGKGYSVIAIDINVLPLQDLKTPLLSSVRVDLEAEAPWPFKPGSFGGVVVTNYLHRPIFQNIIDSLAQDGLLIYETFTQGNEKFGKPSNPNYLLKPGELIHLTLNELHILSYEDITTNQPKPARLQRICARKNSVEA